MTESTTLKSDLAKINDTKSAEEVRRAPAKPLNAGEELVKVILNADDSTKALINRALGNPPVRKRKNRDQNSDAREMVRSNGESIRDADTTTLKLRDKRQTDENAPDAYIELTYDGFVPVPPEGVVEKGAEAIGIWIENWRMGNHISTGSMDFDSELQDAEALSRIAHM
jgi:hypothetical protein|tara:strand:+ start:512 stop:1018 length:507 start_codon:yes stop_codon:yes gene_type:complete